MKPDLWTQAQLLAVSAARWIMNACLEIERRILFPRALRNPQNILVYKIGNIGDIVCAIPALVAVRRRYPNARITLLTSPGAPGMPGAAELLANAPYLDDMVVYHSPAVAPGRRREFIRKLRGNRYDLFIQLPDDLASFRTLARNELFAKAIGAKYAIGFVARTLQLFKRAQVDYWTQRPEAESLTRLLRRYGIGDGAVVFDFPLSKEVRARAEALLAEFPKKDGPFIILAPSGKRPGNRWPKERFRALAARLARTHGARIMVVGGAADRELAEEVIQDLPADRRRAVAGETSLLESAALVQAADLFVGNSSGLLHIAAALGTPVVGFYGLRDVFGRWFPYGQEKRALHHRFFPCDYRDEACIVRGIEAISVKEAVEACEDALRGRHV